MTTYTPISYGARFSISPGPRRYSLCTKGQVTKVLAHRFPVKEGLTDVEVTQWYMEQAQQRLLRSL